MTRASRQARAERHDLRCTVNGSAEMTDMSLEQAYARPF